MAKNEEIDAAIAELKESNGKKIQALVDANYVFESDELILARVNLLSAIMVEVGIVGTKDIEVRWELVLEEMLNNAIADIERRNEIIHKEAHE